jgi:hypothetical protein
MNFTDEQKATAKRCLENAKWKTVLKPIIKDIYFDNIGVATSTEKLLGRKDIISLFDEIVKE